MCSREVSPGHFDASWRLAKRRHHQPADFPFPGTALPMDLGQFLVAHPAKAAPVNQTAERITTNAERASSLVGSWSLSRSKGARSLAQSPMFGICGGFRGRGFSADYEHREFGGSRRSPQPNP